MNKKIFLGIGILWIIIILGFVAFKEFTLKTGEEVMLKTMPIDPRDLFRGDYVILSYEIGNLDIGSLPTNSTNFRVNDQVYVALIKEENYGVASGIYKKH